MITKTRIIGNNQKSIDSSNNYKQIHTHTHTHAHAHAHTHTHTHPLTEGRMH